MQIIVNEQPTSYVDSGEGEVVLLLHGWGMSAATFKQLAQSLRGDYRVIVLDFPGFGRSPKPNTDWYVDDYAQFVAAFLGKLNIDKLHVAIGHSFGGRVILKAVGNGYIDPIKVILMGSAGVKPATSANKLLYAFIAKVGKQVVKLPILNKFQAKLRRRLYEAAGSTDYLEAEAMRPIFLHTINEDLQTDAARIQQPSLLIWGENDVSTPVADGRILQAAMKNSKLIVVPNAGHFVYIDKYDDVVQIVKDFI